MFRTRGNLKESLGDISVGGSTGIILSGDVTALGHVAVVGSTDELVPSLETAESVVGDILGHFLGDRGHVVKDPPGTTKHGAAERDANISFGGHRVSESINVTDTGNLLLLLPVVAMVNDTDGKASIGSSGCDSALHLVGYGRVGTVLTALITGRAAKETLSVCKEASTTLTVSVFFYSQESKLLVSGRVHQYRCSSTPYQRQ